MHFRPPEEQNDHKVTCGVSTAVLQCVLDSISGQLNQARVQANIITSGTGRERPQEGKRWMLHDEFVGGLGRRWHDQAP